MTEAGDDHIDLAMYGDGPYLREMGKAGYALVYNRVACGVRDDGARVERRWEFPVLGLSGFMPRWYSSITEAVACLDAIEMAIEEIEVVLSLLQGNYAHSPRTEAFKFFTDNQFWLNTILDIQEGADREVSKQIRPHPTLCAR